MRYIFIKLVFYYLNTIISYKINFFKDLGETHEISEYSLKNSKKIVSAIANIAYNLKKNQLNLINFKDLISPKN